MTRRIPPRIVTYTAAFVLFVCGAAASAPARDNAVPGGGGGGWTTAPTDPYSQLFVRENPHAGFYRTEAGRLASVYGPAFSTGNTAADTAAFFVNRYSPMLGSLVADLVPGSTLTDSGLSQQLLFIPETGQYAFTLVYYSQFRDGIPVFRADLRLLTRNEPGHPLVLVKSAVRDLGGFQVPQGWQAQSLTFKGVQDAVRAVSPAMTIFAGQRLVIWAGYDDQMVAAPRLAYEISAQNGPPAAVGYEHRLYLVDALNGAVLYSESLVNDVDVTGTVTGVATPGNVADICATEAAAPLPYAQVSIGATTAYANASGQFTIPNAGSGAVTVTSPMSGLRFVVNDQAQASESLSQSVTPPGPVSFVHNATNTSEFVRAEVNTYIAANTARDYLLSFIPNYPTIANQTGFPINANLAQTCNAFYDGGSINFYRSGGGCSNTGFSNVVYHEYGHHMVSSGGSGQGEYGEGMADCDAIAVSDQSVIGYGFQNNCGAGIRDANNTCQYVAGGCSTCGTEIHDCGRLIGGCVWSTRNNLLTTNPSTYRSVLSALVYNAIHLHQGTSITPQITIDYLTIDDGFPGGDGNIANGSPHYNEINAAFTAHNMAGPALTGLDFSFPSGRPTLVNPNGGTSFPVQVFGVTATPQPDTGTLSYSTGGSYTTIPMTQTTPNTYTATFPAFPCTTHISYYVSARSTANATFSSPGSAPLSAYTTVSAASILTGFSDDVETDRGWTLGVAGDTATTGQWVRGDPIGTAAQPEDDHTPGAGVNCFFTGQGTVGGGVGQADIDGGATTLVSPTFTAVGFNSPKVSYWRWYSNDQGAAPNADTFVIDISNNNGSSWVNAETVGPAGPDTAGGWIYHEVDVASLLTPTNQMKVRFVASDLGAGSVVEAAIDDFVVFGYQCPPPSCPGDWNHDGTLNSQDYFDFVTAFFANNADFNHDGITNSQDYFDFIVAFFMPC